VINVIQTKAGYVLVYERRDVAMATKRTKRSLAPAAASRAESMNCDSANAENEMDVN